MSAAAQLVASYRPLDSVHAAMTANLWGTLSEYEDALNGLIALKKLSCMLDATEFREVLTVIQEWDGAPGGGYGLLVDVARNCPAKDMVLNALWILTKISDTSEKSDSDSCRALVNLNIIPLFIERLSDEDMNVVEQAAWGLGNFAGDCVEFRDLVHQAGGVAAAVAAVGNPLLPACGRRKVTWAMLNLCRGKPPPRAEQVAGLMEYFTEVLTKLISAREAGEVEVEDEMVKSKETGDILWGISYVTDGDNTQVQIGIDVLPLIVGVLSVPQGVEEPGYGNAPVVERLVPCEQLAYAMEYLPRVELERLCMLNSDIWNCCVCANRRLYNRVRSEVCHESEIRIPAVRIIGNVMTGNDEQTQAAIDCGALRVIESVAASLRPLDDSSSHSATNEWNEVCWILSNVTAGTPAQARLVLRSSLFYNLVMDVFRMTAAHGVQKEVGFAVLNALACIPGEVPLAWIAAAFGYFAASTDEAVDQMLNETLRIVLRLCPAVSTSLSVIGASVTDDSTPESLLLQADTFARDDSTSSTEKLTALMRDYVLPTLYAMGKLDGNENFISDVVGSGVEVAGSEVDAGV